MMRSIGMTPRADATSCAGEEASRAGTLRAEAHAVGEGAGRADPVAEQLARRIAEMEERMRCHGLHDGARLLGVARGMVLESADGTVRKGSGHH